MSESKLENDCGLIIDPTVLADIQAQYRRRAAELAGASQPAPEATGLSQSANGKLPDVSNLTDAERFAAAVEMMPPNVRRLFEHEDPAPYREAESGQERLEREARASFGGWCG
jgi:tRNA/tmRNA/rRNA uracil-C5-methylase (TrmA/RlmC/RlmD family)